MAGRRGRDAGFLASFVSTNLARSARPGIHAEGRRREREELARLVRKLGVDRLELRTDRPYINTLLAFFEQRKKRMRR